MVAKAVAATYLERSQRRRSGVEVGATVDVAKTRREWRGVAIACGGAFASSEVIRLRPIGSSGGQPFFNGELPFFTNDFPGAGGSVTFGTCQIRLPRRRRDQADGPEMRSSGGRGLLSK